MGFRRCIAPVRWHRVAPGQVRKQRLGEGAGRLRVFSQSGQRSNGLLLASTGFFSYLRGCRQINRPVKRRPSREGGQAVDPAREGVPGVLSENGKYSTLRKMALRKGYCGLIFLSGRPPAQYSSSIE